MEILERLADVEKRFEELSLAMGDPQLVADQDRYRQTTRAFAELEKIVLKYR